MILRVKHTDSFAANFTGMIRNLAKISLPFVLLAASQYKADAQVTKLQDYTNNQSATIGTFQGIQLREGGFSGLFPIAGTDGREFWTISDRGVNVDAANANPAGCRPTYDKIYGFPNYAPKIHRIRVNGDSLQILQTTTMKRPNGTNASGLLNPTGFGSTAAEQVSTDTVQNCANFAAKTFPKDVWGIDAEGLAVDRQGNFWICEEGGASIWKLNAFGVVIKRYTPYANLVGAEPQDVLIDTVFKYRKNNRGFEGIAIATSGKIYTMIQSPVLYPNQSTGEATRVHRILEIDPTNDSWRMFAYLNDGIIGASGSNQIRMRDWKIGDIAAINDTTFLVLEAALRGTTDIKRVYKINIKGATPVTSGLYNGKTLEALVDAAGLASAGIIPVQKTLAIDLLANGWPAAYEKAEGLAIINANTVAIVNDNDYGQVSPTENGVATATGIASHLITYGLTGANALTSFNFIGIDLLQGKTAQNSSQSPYVVPSIPGFKATAILTAGDAANNGYRMVGLPDGLGAYDNGDGTFTVLMNHELGNTSGIVRAHGSKGAFVSKWVINKNDLTVVSGADLIQQLRLWNGTGYTTYNAANPFATGLGRFCSADLAKPGAYYNAQTGLGTTARIFLNGEETGSEGRGLAHIATGSEAGTSYELPRLGKFSYENAVAHPASGDKTIVAGLDDATPGQVYFYVGTKTNTGSEIEKAGLTNGNLYAPAVANYILESDGVYPAAGTAFAMVNLGNVQNLTGAQLETASNNAGVTRFLRPEDGAWDPNRPSDFYFVTTNGFNNPSRLWRLRFNDLSNLAAGGTITAVLNGTEGQRMFDNMAIDNSGHIMLQEDVGNNAHIGKIWQYTIGTGNLKIVAQHDSLRFKAGAPLYLTQDEEASGIIDVQEILGPGMFLSSDQAHYGTTTELVEGGQLLALYNPDTDNGNPEINLKGNNISIVAGDNTPLIADNTSFGNVNLGDTPVKQFVIENTGSGSLIVRSIDIYAANASLFSLQNAPAFPLTIAAGGSYTLNVGFAPVVSGNYSAMLQINNNDFNEDPYIVGLAATGYCAPYTTSIAVNPDPAVAGQQAATIYLGYGPSSVILTASANSYGPLSYSWSPVASASASVTVSPQTTTQYTVSVTNAYGCMSSALQTIAVIDIRDGNKNKVFICHNGKVQTISVNAVAEHLAHGDKLGSCNQDSRGLIVSDETESLIYPNPASGDAFLQFNTKETERIALSVSDANGRIIWQQAAKAYAAGEQRVQLPASAWNGGSYVVTINRNGVATTLKLVVIH